MIALPRLLDYPSRSLSLDPVVCLTGPRNLTWFPLDYKKRRSLRIRVVLVHPGQLNRIYKWINNQQIKIYTHTSKKNQQQKNTTPHQAPIGDWGGGGEGLHCFTASMTSNSSPHPLLVSQVKALIYSAYNLFTPLLSVIYTLYCLLSRII